MQEEVVKRQKLRSHQVNLYMISQTSERRNIEKILQKHSSENRLASVKIKENLRNQESGELKERAEARRRNSGAPSKTIGRTLSINSLKVSKIDKYQEEIEKIIDQCADEKESKVKFIKKKYKEEIKQMKSAGDNDSIVKQVIKEIKQNLKSEINEIDKEMREKKKNMIDKVKSNYS